jgi:nucleoid DNA-binding protein
MKKSDIIVSLAAVTGLTKADADRFLKSFPTITSADGIIREEIRCVRH